MQCRDGMSVFPRVNDDGEVLASLQEVASLLSGLACGDPSLARQSQAEDADINVIVKRFGLTGKLPDNVRPPTYADFEDVWDFQTAMNAVVAAQASFMAMPADVRARFGNDPHQFVEFCSDEKNLDEMRRLGLAVSRAAADAEAVPAAAAVGGSGAPPTVP